MGPRLAVVRNVLKLWLLLAVPALAMGFVGWQLGGYRLGLLFLGSVVLLAGALYWYADRIVMGMVGAHELLPGEAPALHATVESLAGNRPDPVPLAFVHQDPCFQHQRRLANERRLRAGSRIDGVDATDHDPDGRDADRSGPGRLAEDAGGVRCGLYDCIFGTG